MEAIRRFFQRSKKEGECINLEDLRVLSQGNIHLAVKLHRFLSEEKGNILFSPYDISVGIAMLLSASRGETESQLRTALGLEHSPMESRVVSRAYAQNAKDFLGESDHYTIYTSDMILNPRALEVKYAYKCLLAQCYRALMLEVDFAKENKRTIQQANEWIRMKTYDMIPKTIQTVDPDSSLVLINVIYFKGKWLVKFPKEATLLEKFYNNGSENNPRSVPTMHVTDSFRFYSGDSFDALKLSYADRDMAMFILLPHEIDGLESVETQITSCFIQEFMRNLKESRVSVSLPRFRLEYSKPFIPCFRLLGIERIFDPEAEFIMAINAENLMITEVVHKAVIEVNENYKDDEHPQVPEDQPLEEPIPPEHTFTVNHPFIFLIYHTRLDLIIFMGRVEELRSL